MILKFEHTYLFHTRHLWTFHLQWWEKRIWPSSRGSSTSHSNSYNSSTRVQFCRPSTQTTPWRQSVTKVRSPEVVTDWHSHSVFWSPSSVCCGRGPLLRLVQPHLGKNQEQWDWQFIDDLTNERWEDERLERLEVWYTVYPIFTGWEGNTRRYTRGQ